ncbi:TauD/TfdA dioxygenase family protein [Allopusillimonas ginsengisoli]|uniref:TauD/TfdA dioxygenase family protein n=1 Tax=Allopusillimonas ginsengisoli TaxID=453575 RepID=UPI001FD67910|nr:TauD/TfdA family dioxygenase [Allopusillimonas ginsengisoli]
MENAEGVTAQIIAQPLGEHLAAQVTGVDISKPMSAEALQAINDLWGQYLVLRFRGQERLSPEELIRFSKQFGALDSRPIGTRTRAVGPASAFPEITTISNIQIGGQSIGGLGAGEAVWHTDMSYATNPPKAACLYSLEVPESGGNTHFLNMYTAYETLPAALKARVDRLTCLHDASHNSAGELRLGFKQVDDPRETVGAVHPLVRVHPETQRKCLFLGRRQNAYVVGLPLEESEALLDDLWAHATNPALAWSQTWKPGDLVMWDNRCTMHRRDAFDDAARRLMIRTQISGEPVHRPLN